MKRYLTQWFVGSLLFLLCIFSAQAATPAKTLEMYKVDPLHTYILWHINHFGFSNPSGKWIAEGTLQMDDTNPRDSKVNITVPVANFITGIPELDKHLKGDLFFNVAHFPTATFVSDKVEVTSKTTAKVYGMLTVRGITKPVVLDVTLNKIGISPINDKKTVGFSATTLLKRSDFGITTLLPGLSDEVKIDIELEAYKNS